MKHAYPPHTHPLNLPPDAWGSRAQAQQHNDQDAAAPTADGLRPAKGEQDQMMTAGTVLLIVVALVGMWLLGWFA